MGLNYAEEISEEGKLAEDSDVRVILGACAELADANGGLLVTMHGGSDGRYLSVLVLLESDRAFHNDLQNALSPLLAKWESAGKMGASADFREDLE